MIDYVVISKLWSTRCPFNIAILRLLLTAISIMCTGVDQHSLYLFNMSPKLTTTYTYIIIMTMNIIITTTIRRTLSLCFAYIWISIRWFLPKSPFQDATPYHSDRRSLEYGQSEWRVLTGVTGEPVGVWHRLRGIWRLATEPGQWLYNCINIVFCS